MASLLDIVTDVTFAGLLPLSVAATVTIPGGSPVSADGIWLIPQMDEFPAGANLQRREVRRVMALRRSQVPTVPRGTLISAPEKPGDAATTWRVDGVELKEADHHRVVLIPEP